MALGRHSTRARRLYLHKLYGGNLKVRDFEYMVEGTASLVKEITTRGGSVPVYQRDVASRCLHQALNGSPPSADDVSRIVEIIEGLEAQLEGME